MTLTKMDVTVDSRGEKVSVTLGEKPTADDVESMPDPAKIDHRSPTQKEADKRNPPSNKTDDKVAVPPV